MTIVTRGIRRSSPLGILARHPVCFLPPNDVDYYNTSTAGTALVAGSAFPNRVATAFGPGGLPANANIQVTVGGTFTAGKTVRVEITGRDANHVVTTETVICTGNGAATQNFPTKTLWSHIQTLIVREIIGTLVVTELFTIGIGDGAASPAINTLKILNPVPGLGVAQVTFTLTGVAPTTQILATAVTDNGRTLIMGAGYTATNLVRVACVQVFADAETMESSMPIP